MTTLSEQQNEESPDISPNRKRGITDDYDISPGKNRFKLNKIKAEKLSDDEFMYVSPIKTK
jgi:hypothetical protein